MSWCFLYLELESTVGNCPLVCLIWPRAHVPLPSTFSLQCQLFKAFFFVGRAKSMPVALPRTPLLSFSLFFLFLRLSVPLFFSTFLCLLFFSLSLSPPLSVFIPPVLCLCLSPFPPQFLTSLSFFIFLIPC